MFEGLHLKRPANGEILKPDMLRRNGANRETVLSVLGVCGGESMVGMISGKGTF